MYTFERTDLLSVYVAKGEERHIVFTVSKAGSPRILYIDNLVTKRRETPPFLPKYDEIVRQVWQGCSK